MLSDIFYTVLKMNCIASVVAVVLLLVKFVLQKIGCPRKIMLLLWAVIAFRLICPTSLSTELSSFNLVKTFKNAICNNATIHDDILQNNAVVYYQTPQETDAFLANNELPAARANVPQKDMKEIVGLYLASVWIVGMCVMAAVGVIAYIILRKRLRFAIKLKDNIYFAENIPTSFVFGIFRPKIYVPYNMSETSLGHIIAHEKTHIRRKDHLSKIMAYMLLTVHWFNPLNWLLFKLFSDDMEFSCDESVMSKIGFENKKEYLYSLISSATNNRNTIFIYSVCFSVNTTKRRIKNMIRFKKQSKFLAVAAILSCLALVVAFGTNATVHTEKQNDIKAGDFNIIPNEGSEGFASVPATASADISADNVDVPVENVGSTENVTGPHKAITKEGGSTPVPVDTYSSYSPQPTVEDDNITPNPKRYDSAPAKTPDIEVAIDFEQQLFETDTKISSIETNLNNQGITRAQSTGVKLAENYVINDYSYKNNCNGTSSNITCNKNGKISVYFDVNSENLVAISFTDCKTKEVVAEFEILANEQNTYSFTGFNGDKTYDVTVQGKTQGNWKIEGQYILY